MKKVTRMIPLLVGLPNVIFASNPGVEIRQIRGEVVNYGLAARTDSETVYQPETTTGYRIISNDLTIAEKTMLVPCEYNVAFVFKYIVTGLPADSQIILKKVVTHPPMKKPDGSVSTGYETTNDEQSDSEGTVVAETGYVLNRDFELVAGMWKFIMYYKENVVVEQKFEVVKGGKCI